MKDIISDQKMLEILAKAFPNKNNEQLENLIKTAANELDLSDTSRIAYKDLLGQVTILISCKLEMSFS
jgi:hypothetical protein